MKDKDKSKPEKYNRQNKEKTQKEQAQERDSQLLKYPFQMDTERKECYLGSLSS